MNDKTTDKRISSIISSVDKGTKEPDKQFLQKLRERSALEFASNSARSSKKLAKTINFSKWRIIMRSKIAKFATAALLITTIIFFVKHFGLPIEGTSNAFGGMIESMKKMPWVHCLTTFTGSGEKIYERWYGLEAGISASKDYKEADLLFINARENNEYFFKEDEQKIYYSQIDERVRPNGYVPDSAFELVEEMAKYIDEYASEITHKKIILDNREVEIITADARTNEESIFNEIELVLDVRKNLLLRVRTDYKDVHAYVLASEPEETKKQWLDSRKDRVTIYDYPDTGPNSIYDLGAPSDAEVIVSTLPIEIRKIIEKINSLRESMLTRYAAIAISGDTDTLPTSPEGLRSAAFFYNNDHSIYSIWRRGDSIRFSQGYFPISENVQAGQDFSKNLEFWVEQIAPVREFIIKPENDNKYRQYFWENVGTNIRSEYKIHKSHLYQGAEFLIENCWPRIVVPLQTAMQWSIENLNVAAGKQLIMITRKTDTTTEKWYINPGKNDICQKHELYRSNGTLAYCKEILEYATTKSGQFYPRNIRMIRYNQEKNKLVQETATKIIYLKENPAYPDWIFDPNSFPESNQ